MKNNAGLKSPVSAKQLSAENTLACHIPVPVGYRIYVAWCSSCFYSALMLSSVMAAGLIFIPSRRLRTPS